MKMKMKTMSETAEEEWGRRLRQQLLPAHSPRGVIFVPSPRNCPLTAQEAYESLAMHVILSPSAIELKKKIVLLQFFFSN